MTSLPPFNDIFDEYELLEGEDRYRLLIDLGRQLEPMPDALKTDATKVRGCSASVWVYPTVTADGRLHFLADSNAAITKGIVALVLPRFRTSRPTRSRAWMWPRRSRRSSWQAPQRQPHAGRPEHDRADQRDRPAARRMSDAEQVRAGFDPERFFELARRVGHGRALGLEYRDSGDELDGAVPSVARGAGRRAGKRECWPRARSSA